MMGFANMEDITRLRGGTARFTYNETAFIGVIEEINYVPLGPGGINVSLASVQTVDGNVPVAEVNELLTFTISCLMAEIDDRPRELIIHHVFPREGFGQFFSFQVKG